MKCTKELWLRLKGDAEEYIAVVDEALSLMHTPEMQSLREQLDTARQALTTILEVHEMDPEKDLDSLTHCVFWLLISHVGGIEEFKQELEQIKAGGGRNIKTPANTNRIRKSQRRRP